MRSRLAVWYAFAEHGNSRSLLPVGCIAPDAPEAARGMTFVPYLVEQTPRNVEESHLGGDRP
jgi:hypothetical protein